MEQQMRTSVRPPPILDINGFNRGHGFPLSHTALSLGALRDSLWAVCQSCGVLPPGRDEPGRREKDYLSGRQCGCGVPPWRLQTRIILSGYANPVPGNTDILPRKANTLSRFFGSESVFVCFLFLRPKLSTVMSL